MYENILSNMLGCQTYCISDSPSNRYCLIGPIEWPHGHWQQAHRRHGSGGN